MPQRTEDARLVSPNGDDIPLYLAEPPAQMSTRVKRDLSPKITDSQGVGYQNADERWLVFEQSDWAGGAGADKVRQEYGSETRYASANGVITWIPGEVSPFFACDSVLRTAALLQDWLPPSDWRRTYAPHPMHAIDPVAEDRGEDAYLVIQSSTNAALPPTQVFTPYYPANLEDLEESLGATEIYGTRDTPSPIGSAAVFQRHLVIPVNDWGIRVVRLDVNQETQVAYGPNISVGGETTPVYQADSVITTSNAQSHCFAGVNAEGNPVLIYTDGINYQQANRTDATLEDQHDSRNPAWPDWQFSNPVRIGNPDATPDRRGLSMMMFKNRLLVGRSDGLWIYDEDDAKFVNIEPEVGFKNDRYGAMCASANEVYATYGKTSLVRIVDPLGDAPEFFDITTRIQHAHWRGVTGEIRGLAAWRGYILVVADGYAPEVTQLPQDLSTSTPLTAQFGSGHARLMLYDPSTDTGHILHQFKMDNVYGIEVENRFGYVYVYGTTSDATGAQQVARYRYRPSETEPYPTLIDNPDWRFPAGGGVDEDNPAFFQSGWVTTPWIDHSYIDDTKTLDHVRCVYQTQSDGGGIKVEYRIEEPGETLEGTSDYVGEVSEFLTESGRFVRDIKDFHDDVREYKQSINGLTQRLRTLASEINDPGLTENTDEVVARAAEFISDTEDFSDEADEFLEESNRYLTESRQFVTETRQATSDAPDTHPHSWRELGVLTRGRQVLRQPPRDERLRYSRIRFRFTLLGMTKLEQVVVVSKLDQKLEREFSLGLSFRDTPNDVRPEKTLRKLEAWRKQREQYRFVPVSNSLAWLDEATVEIVDLEIQTGDAAGIDGSSQRQLGADAILRLEEVDY